MTITTTTDPDLTDDEALLAGTVRDYFADFVDNAYLNQQEAAESGYEPARWKQLCELGWATINLPERVGGGGGTLAEAGVVAREAGRAAYASPLLSTMRTATVLADLGPDGRFDAELARIVGGAPAALVAPPDRTVHAVASGYGGYRLAGEPAIVEWLAESTDVVLLLPVPRGQDWLCAVLPREALADRMVPVPSIDNERAARLELDGLLLPPDFVGTEHLSATDAEGVLARANLLRASAMVGGCEAVLAQSARYAMQRHQFGQPIGGFQAVRHLLARMVIATDAARLTCNEALTADGESAIAAVALFAAGRSYVDVVLTGAEVHGGVGTTVEHILHHHFLRAKAMRLRSGKRANRLREIHQALVCRGEASLW